MWNVRLPCILFLHHHLESLWPSGVRDIAGLLCLLSVLETHRCDQTRPGSDSAGLDSVLVAVTNPTSPDSLRALVEAV